VEDPGPAVRQAVHQIWAYLKATKHYVLRFDRNKDANIIIYADSDYCSNDPDTRRSISGAVACMHGGAILAASKGQTSVSLSTAEAELKALTKAGKYAVHLRELATELQLMTTADPIVIKEDNEPAKTIANTGKRNGKKAMETSAFWICEKQASGIVDVQSISSKDNVADLMTKLSFTFDLFNKLRTGLGIVDPKAPSTPTPCAFMTDKTRHQLQIDLMTMHRSLGFVGLPTLQDYARHVPTIFKYPALRRYTLQVTDFECLDDKHGNARHKNTKKTVSSRHHDPGTALTVDASGPFSPSISGKKHRLTFKDLSTSVKKSYFGKEMTTEFVITSFRQCLKWFWIQMGIKVVYVKLLRTDYAKAFTSHEFREFVANHGIKHEGPAPYEHSGLGTSEKEVQDADNAQIKNMESSGFAEHRPTLWAEVASSNELVQNVRPRKVNKYLSNMQMLDPTHVFDLNRIIDKPIGCLVFATRPLKGNGLGSQKKGKSKIFACVLVGHQAPLESKDVYRVSKLSNGRILTTRSIKAYPTVFPYKSPQNGDDWRKIIPSAEEFLLEGEPADPEQEHKSSSPSEPSSELFSENSSDSDDGQVTLRRSSRVTNKPTLLLPSSMEVYNH
jgi:hypothetical protein